MDTEIPFLPKLSLSSVVGFIKGKRAIFVAGNVSGRRRNFVGESFWARGFYVSTIGPDKEVSRNYIKQHEKEDHRPVNIAIGCRL